MMREEGDEERDDDASTMPANRPFNGNLCHFYVGIVCFVRKWAQKLNLTSFRPAHNSFVSISTSNICSIVGLASLESTVAIHCFFLPSQYSYGPILILPITCKLKMLINRQDGQFSQLCTDAIIIQGVSSVYRRATKGCIHRCWR